MVLELTGCVVPLVPLVALVALSALVVLVAWAEQFLQCGSGAQYTREKRDGLSSNLASLEATLVQNYDLPTYQPTVEGEV